MAWGKNNGLVERIGAREAHERQVRQAQEAQRLARKDEFDQGGMTANLRDQYRGQAVATYEQRIQTTRGSLGTHVGCIMFYNLEGVLRHNIATSGAVSADEEPQLRNIRRKAHVSLDKVTICAEERLLVKHPRPADRPYLFSIAFNADEILRACNNGMLHNMGSSNCTSILRSSGIEDLAHVLLQ